jgi:YfiH family protein
VTAPVTRRDARAGAPRVLLGARVWWTGRAEGDLRPAEPATAGRLDDLVGAPVSWVRQVHGDRVVVVGGDGREVVRGAEGDALVTAEPDLPLAVLTADCAPVALASPEGVVAAVHAGWAGVVAGVVDRAVAAMRDLGATDVQGALGPCIRPECYRFGESDLERVVGALGPSVRGVTTSGAPALDLPAAVRAALARAGAELVADEGICTACAADDCYSHRARREPERQAMVVWRAA